MDSETAKKVTDLARQASGFLDHSIREVMDNCPHGEFFEYRRTVGRIMGAIYLDILQPLWENHPDIVPPEMRPPPKE